jgi:hypothetical protein
MIQASLWSEAVLEIGKGQECAKMRKSQSLGLALDRCKARAR